MKKFICGLISIFLIGAASGCSKEPSNFQGTGGSDETQNTTMQMEQQALAMFGDANEGGYYIIDLPRSQSDISLLEEINNRLYFVSVSMVQQGITEFKNPPSNLIWQTLLMEISFNYADASPFKEKSDGSGTTVAVNDFKSFAQSCFAIDGELSQNGMPPNFSQNGDAMDITYSELETSSPGFVMTEYKQDNKTWYVKGEIIGLDNTIFAKGEFQLEQNSSTNTVSYKILSFTKE